MTPTILTCGQLRLTVPSGATLPSVNIRPSGVVDLSFHAFTGTLTFETIPPQHQALRAVQPLQPLPSQPLPSQPLASQPLASQPLASQPLASQPLASQPHASQPHASQPLPSQPFPPQDLAPQHLQPLQRYPISSQPLSVPSPPLSEDLLNFNTFPSAQVPDSLTDSQLQPTPAPQLPHFTHNHTNYLSLTPPSSQESDEPPLSPAPVKPVKSHPEKRPATAKVEYRPSKQGKRVRFEENPVILQSPTNSPSHSPTKSPNSFAKAPVPWEPVVPSNSQNIPHRRWGATFTRLQASRSVILLGGESEADGFVKQMSIFDVDNNNWLQDGNDTPDMPDDGRAWHTTTCVDLSLFVFGGEKDVDGQRTQTNDALMYDTTYYTWYPPALTGQPPIPRAGHCAALVPGTKNIIIYGGINGNKWLNDLHLLEELNSWSKVRLSTKSVRPSARSYASITPAAGFLVLFGGNNKTRCFNDVHLLTPDLTWVEPVILGRSPKPRTGHCAIPSRDGNKVILYGGWDDQGAKRLFYSDVWILNIKSQAECQWKCIYAGDNTLKNPGPRAGAALCSVTEEQDDMLLFGGWFQLSYFNDLTRLVLPGERKPSPCSST